MLLPNAHNSVNYGFTEVDNSFNNHINARYYTVNETHNEVSTNLVSIKLFNPVDGVTERFLDVTHNIINAETTECQTELIEQIYKSLFDSLEYIGEDLKTHKSIDQIADTSNKSCDYFGRLINSIVEQGVLSNPVFELDNNVGNFCGKLAKISIKQIKYRRQNLETRN